MSLISLFLLYKCALTVQITCPSSPKFYVDCSINRTINNSIQLCKSYHMTLLQLTNSSSSSSDIYLLNNTMASANCSGNFWFSANNDTNLVGNTNNLDSNFFSAFSALFNIIFCLFGGCTTTQAITSAITVCTRSLQNNINKKCPIEPQQNLQSGIRTYSFIKKDMYTGILNIVTAQSRTACHGICSSNNICIGTTFENEKCTLYL